MSVLDSQFLVVKFVRHRKTGGIWYRWLDEQWQVVTVAEMFLLDRILELEAAP